MEEVQKAGENKIKSVASGEVSYSLFNLLFVNILLIRETRHFSIKLHSRLILVFLNLNFKSYLKIV